MIMRKNYVGWAGNVCNFPREITETALAHVMGDKAEQAYRRRDALEKRRELMEAWSAYREPQDFGKRRADARNSQLDQRMQSLDRGLAALHRNK